MAFPKPRCPPGLALHRGHQVSRDPLWTRGAGRGGPQVQAASILPAAAATLPSSCRRRPRPGASPSPQVHLRWEELKLIPPPQQARMKRRQKSRMLVNEGGGWPAAPGRRARHTTGTVECVWHRTMISPEVREAGAPGAILTAEQPAIAANKTARREASHLLTGVWLGIYFWVFPSPLCCPSCWGICSTWGGRGGDV